MSSKNEADYTEINVIRHIDERGRWQVDIQCGPKKWLATGMSDSVGEASVESREYVSHWMIVKLPELFDNRR